MKNKSSAGPDKISNKLLKMIIDPICIPLCYLFNLSFKSGIVPTHFKTAKCVAFQIMKYLNKYDILYHHQYDFRPKHSTVHQIGHFLDKIVDWLNKDVPEFTLGIFIDLKKASNTCNVNIMLANTLILMVTHHQ